jgi:hypothetical protein
MDGLQEKNRLLTAKNAEYSLLAQKRAEAEYAYSVTKARKIIEHRADGCAVSLVSDLVKGDKEVAKAKMDMDIADGVLKACRTSIQSLLSAIDTYRSLLSFMKEELGRS